MASFVAIELRAVKPLVPFSIFRIRTLTGANVVGLLVGASLFSMFFFISLYRGSRRRRRLASGLINSSSLANGLTEGFQSAFLGGAAIVRITDRFSRI